MKGAKDNVPKDGRGRVKGSKNNLPFTTFAESIGYAKSIWEGAQYNEMSFDEISKFMGLKREKSVRVLSSLKDFYGVVEKLESGRWRLTEAGKKIARNDRAALTEVFSKNPMFKELLNEFLDSPVTEGGILERIRKNYRYVDHEEVKKRLLEGVEIIKKAPQTTPEQNRSESGSSSLLLLQLKYALQPPSNDEIEEIVERVVKVLKDSNDDALDLIADLMLEKKDDKEELLSLLERAMKKMNITIVEKESEE